MEPHHSCAAARPTGTSTTDQGGTAIPLNDTGREQVRTAIGAPGRSRWNHRGRIVRPLSRAVESAEVINEGMGVLYSMLKDGFQELLLAT